MKRILANDGIDQLGKLMLEEAGFFVDTHHVAEGHLAEAINNNHIDVLLVRSATKVRKSLIDLCPNLKLIGRAGVGMDNIDVSYAEEKGIRVVNTPASSSQSVAELVFAHLFSGARFLQVSNHDMRHGGDEKFNDLKKQYSAGIELQGKTIGIVGIGRIGQAVAKMAIGLGMKVVAFDPHIKEVKLSIPIIQNGETIEISLKTTTLDEVLRESDFITLHVPGMINGKALIGKEELGMMKKHAAIVNASRGGVIDEAALQYSLDHGHLMFAGLDVFANEPTPDVTLLHNKRISITPHIGASTKEAQERIGKEMAQTIIAFFQNK
jgi:D-3-phosphoglycerate dehydrogenase